MTKLNVRIQDLLMSIEKLLISIDTNIYDSWLCVGGIVGDLINYLKIYKTCYKWLWYNI